MPFDALEYVVRPYTAPNAQGQIVIPSTPRSSRDRATITWGAKSTMPPVQTGVNFQVVCCKDTLTEKSRQSKRIRVFQNNDENSPNWTDWDRPEQVTLDKKEHNTCGDNWDDISGVAATIDADLAAYTAMFNSYVGTSDKNCGTQWNFKNQ